MDAWAFCEMHVHGTNIEKVRRIFLKKGWNARIAPGQVRQETDDRTTGTQEDQLQGEAMQQRGSCKLPGVEGGVSLGVKRHINFTWVPKELTNQYEDMEAGIIQFKRVRVLLISTYLRPGCNLMKGRNLKRLHGLWWLIQQLMIPWIACADWNATPEEMSKGGWLGKLQATLVVDGVAATCTAGGGRILDYILAGGGAMSLTKSVVEMEGAPWRLH